MDNNKINTDTATSGGNVNNSCRKKSKTLIITATILSLVLIFLPFVSTVVAVACLPSAYGEIYHASLADKYERLNSLEGRKIVVVGGSSVAFGIDSEKLEEYTGLPVVNFGLYADLGTKIMLDLSLSGVSEGDIVIFSPECDAQTLSLYFNSEIAAQALEGNKSMFFELPFENQTAVLASSWNHLGDKLDRLLNGYTVDESGIYLSKYFDEYGDFDYPRAENALFPTYYDVSKPIDLSREMLYADPSYDFDEFAEYFNSYCEQLYQKGADVYFSWCPMNSLAVTSSPSEREEFAEYMEEMLNCEFISSIDDYIMEPGYFFDTNFHLNDAGVQYRTLALAWDLKFARDDMLGLIPTLSDAPSPPELPGADTRFEGYDENSVYFTYEYDSVSCGYFITGLSELGKEQSELTVPLGYEGRTVILAKSGAFSDCPNLKKLVITADSNLSMFENGAFSGASELRDLWIYKGPDEIMPPADFVGTADGFTVHVPEGSGYSVHYYWSERGIENFTEDAN